jgi:hypothetical protein
VPEIFGTLPMTVLVMDKGNRFHSILLEILRLISTGLRSWSFNTILTKREYQLRRIVLLGLTTLIAQSNQTIIYPIKIGIKWSDGGGGGGGGGLILGDRQAQGACWDIMMFSSGGTWNLKMLCKCHF